MRPTRRQILRLTGSLWALAAPTGLLNAQCLVPAVSVAELLNLARAKPDELSYVSPGIGTPGHLASSMLLYLTGTKATHIPYKGGGQAVVDLVAGHATVKADPFRREPPASAEMQRSPEARG